MNYADFGLGTWHPKSGMYAIVEAMVALAKELGVNFNTDAAVEKIVVENNKAKGVHVNGTFLPADVVLKRRRLPPQ